MDEENEAYLYFRILINYYKAKIRKVENIVISFWWKRSVDIKFGAKFTCMRILKKNTKICFWTIDTKYILESYFILVHSCDTDINAGCSDICNKKGDGFECACEAGFELDSDKKTCVRGIAWFYFGLAFRYGNILTFFIS